MTLVLIYNRSTQRYRWAAVLERGLVVVRCSRTYPTRSRALFAGEMWLRMRGYLDGQISPKRVQDQEEEG